LAVPELLLAAAAVGACVLIARSLEPTQPTRIDQRARNLTRRLRARGVDSAMWPLFPLGLPGGYIGMAYATSYWLRRRSRRGGPAIETAAWLGWLGHRAAKLFYERERPRRRGEKRRTDSYPSGHTTGATALALTTAWVLRRQRLISAPGSMLIALGAPAVMGVYRVIADDHWATDVLGGWFLGSAIALTCNALLADDLVAVGGSAGPLRASAGKPRASSRRVRPGRPPSAAGSGRVDCPDARACIARLSGR
jgi:membrane-associated phospholipid phosphatase